MDLPAYTVTRKSVRGLRITVKAPGGEVRVSAPRHASDAAIAAFVAEKSAWIAKHRERIAQMPAPLEPGPDAERLRRELKRKIPGLLAYWSDRMGLEPPGFGVRMMRTRWGTCNIQRRHITIGLELARRDDELLEYVIVHELAHLYERGHGPRFYAIMDRYMPDWKAKRRELNG